jgi:hypothetical protein
LTDWPPLTSQVIARVPDALRADLVRLAVDEAVTLGEIMRRALADYCARHDLDDPTQSDAGAGTPAVAASSRARVKAVEPG